MQVCSALGVAPGVKAGALWGRCPGQVLNVETVPDPSVGSASCQHTGSPSQTLLVRAQTGLCCCSLKGAVQLFGVLLRGGSCAVPWFCSQTVKLHWVMWQQRQEILVIAQLPGLGFLFYKCPEVTWAFLLLLLLHCWSSMHAAGWIPELLQVLMVLMVQTQFLNFTPQLKGGWRSRSHCPKLLSFSLHSLLGFVHILGQRSAFLHHLQKWQKMLQTAMHMTMYFKCLDPIFSNVYPATDIKSEPVVLKRNALKTAKKASYKLNSLPLITRMKAFYSP